VVQFARVRACLCRIGTRVSACKVYTIGSSLAYFVAWGVSRLARYNLTADELSEGTEKVKYFEGTPIPTSFLILCVLAAAAWLGALGEQMWLGQRPNRRDIALRQLCSHAKLVVFDRQKIFMGSMNFDERSKHLNTEVGLIIDSTELAQQSAARFDAMVRPENSYALALRPRDGAGPPRLVWRTEEEGKSIEYVREPARSLWQRFKAELMSWLPFDREL
jgi:phosphatidylserine/phosphatidylglycerophosphate/cardiolipin synthase-like enzyme